MRPPFLASWTMLCFLLCSLLCSPSIAQIDVQPSFGQYEPVTWKMQLSDLPEGAKANAIWTVESAGQPFTQVELSEGTFLWGAPGPYSLEAVVVITRSITVDGQSFDVLLPGSFKQYRAQFIIEGQQPDNPQPGPTPGPDVPQPDGPSPVIPDDQFNNLGARVDRWAQGLPKRMQAAKAYREARAKLISVASSTVEQVGNELVAMLMLELGADASKWTDYNKNINADLNGRWLPSYSKQWLADYYTAIITGLEATR